MATRPPRPHGRRIPRNLAEYERKRRFDVTPEPAAAARPARAAGRPTFMVHKHDATRLHYDLRLEMDGALASWAVPKGPSTDPAVRRLAVQTEDHPLEYGAFEGRIPEGEYGAGDSIIWDRGTYDTDPPGEASRQRRKGHLVVVLDGEKLKGRWHLVRTRDDAGGKPQWLLFKAKDEHADPARDIVAERPESVVSGRRVTRGPARKAKPGHPRLSPDALLARTMPPMLAVLVDAAPPEREGWLYELKYDGYRAIAAISRVPSAGKAGGPGGGSGGGRSSPPPRVEVVSRNGLDMAGRFPAIARALGQVAARDAVIDGEIAVLDAKGAPRFELLQTGRDDEAAFFAFDLLWLDGEDLRGRPLEERRDLLASVLANPPPGIRLAEVAGTTAAEALETARRRGFEGVIAKRAGSVYEGRRARTWQKVKVQATQEVAIVGFFPSEAFPGTQVGSLILGVMEGGRLVFAGKVGTGFTAKTRAELRRMLAKERVERPAVHGAPRFRDAVWTEPRHVAQVRFTEWTRDGKLRHPSFQGLREDKGVEECVRERPGTSASAGGGTKRAEATEPPAAGEVHVKITTPDRVYYPGDGYTKRDLIEYFRAVAGPMLRALAGRPLALQHYPKGIAGEPWFQQNIGREAPAWMKLVETPTRTTGRTVRHMVADRPEALVWLAQHSVLQVHMWSSREGSLGSPDWVVFDLDPAPGAGFAQTIRPAKALRTALEAIGIPSVPKTSGGRGLHILVPLLPGHTHEDAVAFALKIGEVVAGALPEVTLERSLSKRRGRLYLDCLQNGYGKTIVAPYSPRAIDGAPVSAPLRWSEVREGLEPSAFTIATMPGRLARVGDLFAPALEGGVRLPRI